MDAQKHRKLVELISNSLLLIILAWFFWNAFYELFIFKIGVHYPRVTLSHNTWGNTAVDFTLNIPTVASFIILFTALISIYASVRIFLIRIFFREQRTKKYWIIQLTGFLICLIALIIEVLNFIGTAYQGVG